MLDSGEYLKVREVAERLRCDRRAILRLIHDGRLRAIKLTQAYRIPEPELARLEREGAAR